MASSEKRGEIRGVDTQGFEVRTFNIGSSIIEHTPPVLAASDSHLPPMERLFSRIAKNDRPFVQQLPVTRKEQKKLGIFLDQADPASGRTPLTAALIRGHLDLAVDLLMRGADSSIVDSIGRSPEAIAGADTMATMVLRFMVLYDNQSTPRSSASLVDKDLQKLLTQIDRDTGQTLLTWAVGQRHEQFVEQLVSSGADLRVCNRFGRAPLEEACMSGSLTTLSYLLEAWPTLASDLNRDYLIAAIRAAAVADRPMALAQMLSFFREEFRLRQEGDADSEDLNPMDPISSRQLTQQDVYRSFLGAQSESCASMDMMMRRTHDKFLLTEREPVAGAELRRGVRAHGETDENYRDHPRACKAACGRMIVSASRTSSVLRAAVWPAAAYRAHQATYRAAFAKVCGPAHSQTGAPSGR